MLILFVSESWAAMKLARAVEQVAIGGVHLMARGAHIALDHSHHHGVEIAYPRQLQRAIIAQATSVNLLLHTADKSTLDTLALILGQHSEDESDDSVGLAAADIPQRL